MYDICNAIYMCCSLLVFGSIQGGIRYEIQHILISVCWWRRSFWSCDHEEHFGDANSQMQASRVWHCQKWYSKCIRGEWTESVSCVSTMKLQYSSQPRVLFPGSETDTQAQVCLPSSFSFLFGYSSFISKFLNFLRNRSYDSK